ncbi:MAG: Glycine dehydrogenase, glycine cleavage system protein [Pseudomonadota bacterium]|jgi:glycine dehydrogenase
MKTVEPIDRLDGLLAEDAFHRRHIGPSTDSQQEMLAVLGLDALQDLIAQTVPAGILRSDLLALPDPLDEPAALAHLRALAQKNQVWRSYIGAGYYGTHTPQPIVRNMLENPGWYTAYTPYQAEVAQGRLEALMNFQQVVVDLTGLPTANASLLDEATAAAEAMGVFLRARKTATAQRYLVDAEVHPQVIAVLRSRARWMGITIEVTDLTRSSGADDLSNVFGAHVQTPTTRGRLVDFSVLAEQLHAQGARLAVGTDLLALLCIKSPGQMGADAALGSAQRFGVPMGFGGPHAAFLSVRADLVRSMPGRIIGVSVDAHGQPAYRMALQTREQHIRRDKATSNICTAQALLANMAGFYAVYHGPEGLSRIALRVNVFARLLAREAGLPVLSASFFDTVVFDAQGQRDAILARARSRQINLRAYPGSTHISVSLDETVGLEDLCDLLWVFSEKTGTPQSLRGLQMASLPESIPEALARTEPVLTHPVFHQYRSETEFVRYLKRLENKDISLVHSMIPLGSCTMKLNAASEMAPVSWPEFAALHPYVPAEQSQGYAEMLKALRDWLVEITGFAEVSFQPNSGAQGEYAGIMAIRLYQAAQGEGHRDVCLIPASAHGTNPATAQMMGLKIVVVGCDQNGNIDLSDLSAKIQEHGSRLSALMVTYPSTHGVFESEIREICAQVHAVGGQVYMDGANLNAQAGLTQPGQIGADVCHMNLHKTFCIPHGGGGPGMGPIAVAAHLAPYLNVDPFTSPDAANSVSAAPVGSALITTISYMYIRMMGASGIRKATEVAILNANYLAHRLKDHFPILYTGAQGRVAHECILDLRGLKAELGVTAEDVAKRLMDYGFHAPTLSFPVADTLMVEPTESESKAELDRFCEAMISIAQEIEKIRRGVFDRVDNPVKNAPHTSRELAADWSHAYSREEAVFPLPWVRTAKFWPSVKRIDNAAGDRTLVCTCPPMASYAEQS